MNVLMITAISAIDTVRYVAAKGKADLHRFNEYILKPCMPSLLALWGVLDVVANDIIAPSLLATIDEVVSDCEGKEAAQAFYAAVSEVVGEAKPTIEPCQVEQAMQQINAAYAPEPTCIQCDKPAEWAEAYCQEHWEQHCADEYYKAVPPTPEAVPTPIPEATRKPRTNGKAKLNKKRTAVV